MCSMYIYIYNIHNTYTLLGNMGLTSSSVAAIEHYWLVKRPILLLRRRNCLCRCPSSSVAWDCCSMVWRWTAGKVEGSGDLCSGLTHVVFSIPIGITTEKLFG